MSLSSLLDSLAGYPRWLVAAGLTLAVAVAIWVAVKLLKVVLYLLLAFVIVAGAVATVWLLFHGP